MHRAWIASALGIVAALSSVAVAAQEVGQEGVDPPAGSAPFVDRVEIEVVSVDVWVADRDGSLVPGLGADDFEVLHDGRPVAISHFTEVRAGRLIVGGSALEGEGGDSANGTGAADAVSSHVVLYFDQSRLHPSNYPPLMRGLEGFLNSEDVDPGRVLIVRQNGGLFIEAPFGSSRRDLQAALGRLSKGTAGGAGLQTEVEQALDEIRRSWEQNQDIAASAQVGISSIPQTTPGGNTTGAPVGGPRAALGGVGTAGGADACGSFVGQVQPVLSSWARSQNSKSAVTLSNLSDIASFLAGLRGVKTLLYLSDGLDTNPGSALASYAASFCPSSATQLMSGARSEEMTSRFMELTRHANSNRVTVHALQATGLRSSTSASASSGRRARGSTARSGGSFEQSQRSSDRSGLELIARETGGRTVFNQNEFGTELEKIAREARSYYSLGYEPPSDAARDTRGREHRIEVKLRDDSLTARYRSGYLDKDRTQRLMERIEGALNLGLTDNPLEVRLGGGAVVAEEGGTYRMPLMVIVPAKKLAFLPGPEGTVAEVAVRVMARAMDSSSLTMFDKVFKIQGAPGAAGFAQLAIDLELGAGAYLTAVGVQDAASSEASYVSTTLQMGPED